MPRPTLPEMHDDGSHGPATRPEHQTARDH